MKLIILSFISLFLFTRAKMKGDMGANDYCQLYGSVYIEQQASLADYSVYVQEDEAFADLVAYKVDDVLFATKKGLWYITDKKAFANHIIYLESNEASADFSVYFTDIESLVGCK